MFQEIHTITLLSSLRTNGLREDCYDTCMSSELYMVAEQVMVQDTV